MQIKKTVERWKRNTNINEKNLIGQKYWHIEIGWKKVTHQYANNVAPQSQSSGNAESTKNEFGSAEWYIFNANIVLFQV